MTGESVQVRRESRLIAARPSVRQARTDKNENPDRTEAALAIEPIESTEASDPAEPIERIEPAEPIDKMDPVEPMLRIDPLDPMLRSDPLSPRIVRMRTFSQQALARRPRARQAAGHGKARGGSGSRPALAV